MITVSLNEIQIRAHHGFYEEEAILGNEFVVDISVDIEYRKEVSDDIKDTINYERLFRIVNEEMMVRSKLLEHVLFRIKANVVSSYPDQVRALRLSIRKLNPPVGGQVASSQITLDESYETKCAKCGGVHSCFNSEDCWCNSINISDVTQEQIRRLYTGCLCNGCLNYYKKDPDLIIQT